MRNPDKSTFCYYPFFQILMSADGKFKPCSKHYDFVTHEGEVLKSGESSISEAWSSDYMVELRRALQNNEKPNGCRECWREMDMGLKPMRYDSYHYNIPESQVAKPDTPMRVEVNASNICNLKCRICMPEASHKWIKEARKIYGKEEEVHFNMTPENLEDIKAWVPNFTEIGFFGGEPLLSRENIELLEYCVETGHAKNIRVLFNTNGTVYKDKIVNLLKHFKKAYVNFSIDDIGERFEYQRKGAKWDKVVMNMKKWLQHGGIRPKDRIECKICTTVSIFNIYYFPEYFEYFNKHFPGMAVYFNLLYEPDAYSVQILPEPVKEIIRNRLKNFVKTSYVQEEYRTKRVEDLLTYLEHTEEMDFNIFYDWTRQHDNYRREDFSKVFPEFWSVIEEYLDFNVELTTSIDMSCKSNDESNRSKLQEPNVTSNVMKLNPAIEKDLLELQQSSNSVLLQGMIEEIKQEYNLSSSRLSDYLSEKNWINNESSTIEYFNGLVECISILKKKEKKEIQEKVNPLINYISENVNQGYADFILKQPVIFLINYFNRNSKEEILKETKNYVQKFEAVS